MTDMASASKKPLSIKDIRKLKDEKRKLESDKLRIYNVSKLQTINIQLMGKNSNLVPYQQSIQIHPGRYVDLPVSRLIKDQVTNLKRMGFIRTTKIDSSKEIDTNDESLKKLPNTIKPNKLKSK